MRVVALRQVAPPRGCSKDNKNTAREARDLGPEMKSWRILWRTGDTSCSSAGSLAAPPVSSCCLTYLSPPPPAPPQSLTHLSPSSLSKLYIVIVVSSWHHQGTFLFLFYVNVWYVFDEQGDFLQKHFLLIFCLTSSSLHRDLMSRRRRLRRPPGAFFFGIIFWCLSCVQTRTTLPKKGNFCSFSPLL